MNRKHRNTENRKPTFTLINASGGTSYGFHFGLVQDLRNAASFPKLSRLATPAKLSQRRDEAPRGFEESLKNHR